MLELIWSPEAAAARDARTPLVALESTIMTHGMPWPQNLATARLVEDDIRAAGAVPATIAVLNGHLHIGLSADQMETLARSRDAAKLSRADLALCLATGGSGATTVAATMIAARLAGIEVFATGGIGGVHRGVADSFDISADLQELAQTRVTVVCAGAKAILDLPKTLEMLETLGVPVIAFGQDSLPAFWSATSRLVAPQRLDSAAQIAAAHRMRAELGLPGGQLIANSIPPGDEIPLATLAPMIERAQDAARAQGITGKAVTPFLLAQLHELSGGRTLRANIALIRHNARLGAAIARALCETRP